MDRKYIDAHHIVERYLADRLPPADKEAFEAYYVAHPEMLDEMEAVAALKVGFGALPAAPPAAAPRHYARFVPAAIAAVLLAAVAAWLLNRPTLETSPALMAARTEELRAGLPAGKSVRIDHQRGIDADAAIELPAQPRALRLRVQPDATLEAASYRLTLLSVGADAEPRTVASLGALQADAEGLVVVFLDSAVLQPGSYELQLADATNSASEEDRFSVAVSAPAP